MPDVGKQIEELRDAIAEWDRMYYTYSEPAVSDAFYDKQFKKLQRLEAEHPEFADPKSPTQRVGGEPIEGLKSVKHRVSMLSIDNGFDMGALEKFHARVAKKLKKEPLYSADWKVDGCAISLIYVDGVLQKAVTRGDGRKGDDITHNAMSIRGIPSKLVRLERKDLPKDDHVIKIDGTVEIRGEVYIPNSVFAELVAAQEKAGEEPFKNSRNAASGALRQHDPKECWKRKLHFIAHGTGQFDPDCYNDSFVETMYALHLMGVPSNCETMNPLSYKTALKQIEQMVAVINGIDLPVDGIVLKLDCFSDRETMGSVSSRHVSWAMAYKWERYEAETKIVRLETQVGKQGTLTPVAYYEPVEIAETTVQKSTLFNFDEVERLDPRVGDVVTLEKAGKIIPHLVRVHTGKRTGRPRKFKPPEKCPVCEADTVREGPLVSCTNTAGCPAQLEAVILAAADRSRLDIDGLGPKAVQAMMAAEYEDGLITSLADLWCLYDTVDDSGAIPGLTPGKSKKLLEALDEAATRPSWRLMASLNIKHVGRTNSELICKAVTARAGKPVDVFEALGKSWDAASLQELEGIGKETALSLVDWLSHESNIQLLKDFRCWGVNTGTGDPPPEVVPDGPRPLDGKNICATGKLVGYTRDGIKQAIKDAGGKPSSSVSGKTDYLVAGADAGSKLTKAQQLDVTVLTEDEFNELVAT
jgi:DNA ligase (NAD+)